MHQHRAHSYLSALVTLVTPEKKNTRGKLRKEGRGRGGRAHRCREVKQRTRKRGAVWTMTQTDRSHFAAGLEGIAFAP